MKNWFRKRMKEKTDCLIQGEVNLKIKTPQEVGERILALLAVIGKVHQGNDNRFLDWFRENAIVLYLSDNEKLFIETNEPIQKQIVNFSWKAEALTSLLWSVELILEMPELNKEFDVYSVEEISSIIQSPNTFIKNIRLRPNSELEKMERDLVHEHWRIRDAQLFGKEIPKELNSSVVYERRYALSWLVGWGEDWDNVPTDT